jgi:hypothetical protein
MDTDDEPDYRPAPVVGREWARRAVAAGSFPVLAISVLAAYVSMADDSADGSAALVAASMFGLLSGAVLILALVLPRIGSKRLAELALQEQLDDQSLELLDRATDAADAIAESLAQRRGLLDGIATSLVVEEQTAEIARKLTVLSDLRRGEREVGATSPEALARLGRQKAAIDDAAASLTRRIEALESYAGQVAELDALLDESEVMERLDERDALVAELVAETARDQPAVEDVDRLARGLPALADALERQLRAVREGGQGFLDAG